MTTAIADTAENIETTANLRLFAIRYTTVYDGDMEELQETRYSASTPEEAIEFLISDLTGEGDSYEDEDEAPDERNIQFQLVNGYVLFLSDEEDLLKVGAGEEALGFWENAAYTRLFEDFHVEDITGTLCPMCNGSGRKPDVGAPNPPALPNVLEPAESVRTYRVWVPITVSLYVEASDAESAQEIGFDAIDVQIEAGSVKVARIGKFGLSEMGIIEVEGDEEDDEDKEGGSL